MVKIFNSKEEAFTRIPNLSTFKIEIENMAICLVNFNNKFYAIQNSCPHLGDSLAKGSVNYLGEVVCPWHSYRFNLKTGEESARRCKDIKLFEVTESDDGGVYLKI